MPIATRVACDRAWSITRTPPLSVEARRLLREALRPDEVAGFAAEAAERSAGELLCSGGANHVRDRGITCGSEGVGAESRGTLWAETKETGGRDPWFEAAAWEGWNFDVPLRGRKWLIA